MRVVIVCSRFPLPPWRGNQVRTLEWLRALRDEPCALVCPLPDDPAGLTQLRDQGVAVIGYRPARISSAATVAAAVAAGRPAQEGLYAARSAKRAVIEALRKHRPDVVIVQMIRCGWALEEVRRTEPRLPVLFDAIDAMGLHFERAVRFSPLPLRPLLRFEAAASRRRERQLGRRADLSVAVSGRDLEVIAPPRGRVVPVSGRIVEGREPSRRSPVVLLSGNLGYRPTVLGARWFAADVWPRVRAEMPEARWVLAGARPTRSVRELARLPGVEVHADVDSLDRYLAEASVAIAPMASGSGVPMKVLEAWAAGLPVVAHPWTADGVVDGGMEALLVAEDAGEWRRAVVDLLSDPESARALGERGREFWRQTYHPDRVDEDLRSALLAAIGGDT